MAKLWILCNMLMIAIPAKYLMMWRITHSWVHVSEGTAQHMNDSHSCHASDVVQDGPLDHIFAEGIAEDGHSVPTSAHTQEDILLSPKARRDCESNHRSSKSNSWRKGVSISRSLEGNGVLRTLCW